MDVLGEDHDLQAVLDRNAFEGIENDAIDFGDLEKYINEDTVTYFDDTLVPSDVARAHAAVVAAAAAGEELGQQQQQPPPDSNKTFGVYVIPSHSLPESPPDSGSEPPYSPPDHGGQSPHQRLSAGRAHGLQDILIQPMFPVHQPLAGPGALPGPGPGPHLVDLPAGGGLGAGLPPGATHTLHLQGAGGEMILVQHPVVPAASLPPAVPSPSPVPGGAGQPAVVYPGLAAAAADTNKKRKLSQDGRIHVKTEPGMVAGGCPCPDVLGGVLEGVLASPPPRVLTARSVPEMSPDPSSNQTGALEEDYGMDCDNPYADSSMQCIRFSAFEKENWHSLIDGNLGELPAPSYQVVADKGFNFSNADDAFVCQKKNHFQITCHVRLHGDAQFVRATSSLQKILSWQLHFYGVKTEATAQTIKVEQSQSDRSKKAFHPVQLSRVELRPDESVKKTVGRLHFSETTSNNMRKKGKPNPDQRYFYLVVGLHAHCADGNAYPVVAHHSERIIVRASNPGQFESDAELCWQKGSVSDSIYHTGKCGINTDRPEEALTVHGNLRITGHVIQPSDLRAKQAIQECDTKQQLRNVQQLRVVHYQYTDEFARHAGLPCTQNTGVIAQQVKAVLPEAVSSAGDVVLPSGARLDNFLVVNKDRLFMENIGAVQALVEVTGNLETRIDELERMNRRLDKMKRRDSLKSVASSVSMRHPRPSKTGSFTSFADGILCSNKLIQSTIVLMVLIIAFCLVAMATLYFLEFQKRNDNYDIPISRQTVIQTQTHPPTMSTPRPSKMRYKSGATPYSKKLTTIAPSLHKQQKAEREGVKAEREEGGGGRAEKATAAPQPPPPPPPPSSTRPPPPPPPPAQPLVLGSPPLCDTDQALCPTYCCLAEPPPAAPAVRDAATNAAPTAPAPPPDPLTKAPPPASFLNTNALSSRPQRAAADEVRNNVDDDPGEQDKHEAQPPTVTLVGAHVNHTLAAAGLGAAANNSYQVFLSRHLPDQELQLHVRFTRPWLKPEQCDSSAAQQCPQELAGVGPGSSWGQPAAGAGPADAAAKQHLSRAGEAAVAADARAAAASDDEHIIFVKIAFHVSNTVVFRVPLGGNPNDVCKRTASFQEYRIHFVRRCDL